MEKKTDNFSPEDIRRIANTPAAQQLLDLIRRTDASALSEAMQQASAGNYKQAKDALASLLSNEKVRALIEQMGDVKDG